MTYVIPHFRYGALIYTPKEKLIEEGKVSGVTFKFRRKHHGTIKKLYDLPKATGTRLLDSIMGRWRTEILYLMNYARNANLWFDTFEYEILHEEAGEIVNSICKKYEAINERLKRNRTDRIIKRTAMEDFDKIFETNKEWNFKKAILESDKTIALVRW